MVGNVDAGKSTLLGVLTHGELDNGRGMARQRLFRHKHEMESGRTSSVGNDILGFDSRGDVVNKPDSHGKQRKNTLCIIFNEIDSGIFNIKVFWSQFCLLECDCLEPLDVQTLMQQFY